MMRRDAQDAVPGALLAGMSATAPSRPLPRQGKPGYLKRRSGPNSLKVPYEVT